MILFWATKAVTSCLVLREPEPRTNVTAHSPDSAAMDGQETAPLKSVRWVGRFTVPLRALNYGTSDEASCLGPHPCSGIPSTSRPTVSGHVSMRGQSMAWRGHRVCSHPTRSLRGERSDRSDANPDGRDSVLHELAEFYLNRSVELRE